MSDARNDAPDEKSERMHNLMHEVMEARGMKALADEVTPIMLLILSIIKQTDLSHPQLLGVLNVMPRLIKETMCDKCQEMAGRIEEQIASEFTVFIAKHRTARDGEGAGN